MDVHVDLSAPLVSLFLKPTYQLTDQQPDILELKIPIMDFPQPLRSVCITPLAPVYFTTALQQGSLLLFYCKSVGGRVPTEPGKMILQKGGIYRIVLRLHTAT